jgi:hypothetical protein
MTDVLQNALPTYFTPGPVNPAPGGLTNAVSWTETVDAPRWLAEGVMILSAVTGNYSGDLSSGVWGANWCSEPGSGSGADEVKDGVRPEDPDPFLPTTVWAFDSCDLTAASRAETLARAEQVMRMRWPIMVAREFGIRILADAGLAGVLAAPDLVAAVGEAEAVFADENVTGMIHASPFLLPHLTSHVLVSRGGVGSWVTPGGHTLIVDGGYRTTFGDDTLVLTSAPLWGWRTPVAIRETLIPESNSNMVVAELSAVVACEAVLGAVSIEAGS